MTGQPAGSLGDAAGRWVWATGVVLDHNQPEPSSSVRTCMERFMRRMTSKKVSDDFSRSSGATLLDYALTASTVSEAVVARHTHPFIALAMSASWGSEGRTPPCAPAGIQSRGLPA